MTYSDFTSLVTERAEATGDTDIQDALHRVVFYDDIETMATNGDNIFVNKGFLDTISPDEIVGVLAHENMHDSLGHTSRAGWAIYDPASGLERDDWHALTNVAQDVVINEWLTTKGGYKVPEWGCFRRTFPKLSPEAKTAQEIFLDLLQQYKDGVKEVVDAVNRAKREMKDKEKIKGKIVKGVGIEGEPDEDEGDIDEIGEEDKKKRIPPPPKELEDLILHEADFDEIADDYYEHEDERDWVAEIFEIVGSRISSVDRRATYARPAHRGDRITPGTDIATRRKGSARGVARSPKCRFYVDVSGSMYYRYIQKPNGTYYEEYVDQPNLIRDRLRMHADKLRSTQSYVLPSASRLGVPLDLDKEIPIGVYGSGDGYEVDRMVQHLSREQADCDISVLVTDMDAGYDVSKIPEDKFVILVTNCPNEVHGKGGKNLIIKIVDSF